MLGVEAGWPDEEDLLATPTGGREIGEIGTAAAIANAAHHATGARVREPVPADRFLD